MDKLFFGKYRRLSLAVYIVLLALWLGFIFSNSALDGKDSTKQSDKVVHIVESIVHTIDPDAEVTSASVRKSAHFFEFSVLGVLYFVATFFFKNKRFYLYTHVVLLSFFTAVLDESLQLFSDGRGAEIRDVWIDFSGALVGILIMFLVFCSRKLFKKHQ